MMIANMKAWIFSLLAFGLALIPFEAKAQFQLTNTDKLAKVKNGTTYIAMKDPNSRGSKEFVDIIKKYWTFSKIEFIKYTDIEKNITPESAFFTMGGYETNVQTMNLYKGGGSGINWSNTHLYLELWTLDDKYLALKKKRPLTNKDHVQVARMELFTDFKTLNAPQNIYLTDYSGEGHIRNWGTGILKNYLQNLMRILESGKEQKLFDEKTDTVKLKELRDKTLYVPDYVLIKFNKFTGDETKKHDENDIFGDYKLKYSLVSIDELNKKILDDNNPIYYMVYIKSSTDKFITLINSKTGEIAYTIYDALSYNLQDGDLKDLQKKIMK